MPEAAMIADVGPLVWVRIRAGLHEATAGRFGRLVIERVESRWHLSVPGLWGEGKSYRTLRAAQARAARWLVRSVASDPRSLREWGAALLLARGAEEKNLYHDVICRRSMPLWFVAFRAEDGQVPDHCLSLCLSLRRLSRGGLPPFPVHVPLLAELADECQADPSLLGVLADAAQDAGDALLEEAARTVADAIAAHRSPYARTEIQGVA